MRIALLFVVAACRKEEPAQTKYAPVDPKPVPVAADAAPVVDVALTRDEPDAALAPTTDGGVIDYSKLVTAEWPSGIEWVKVDRNGLSGRVDMNVSYLRLRSKPKALADAMNAAFTADGTADFTSMKDSSGLYEYFCEPVTISRIAVIIRCRKMLDTHTDAEIAAATGGSPGGPTPAQYSWWMQPGLPAITIDQLAPGIDVGKLLADASKLETKNCNVSFCELKPDSFTIDTDGITFAPTAYCHGCDDLFPKIPLDQLKPQHPWAKKLVEWIHQRADAGESLIKYEATK